MAQRVGMAAGLMLLGIVGCSEPDAGPLLGDGCSEENTVVCAKVTSESERLENVAVCRDGALEILVRCAGIESCVDTAPGVASCTEVNTYVPYAIADATCPSADERACDVDRDNVLVCAAGTWTRDDDCTTEIQRCGVPTGEDTPVCEDP
ncbi:MAG: hypothetical protein AAF721_07205 [Myxococcota bacterium]